MSRERFQPGQIWPGDSLTRRILEGQWAEEFAHLENQPAVAGAAFTEEAREALEWNAREALHLNRQWPGGGRLLRHLFLPQDPVNVHLLRSLEMLFHAWQGLSRNPRMRNLGAEHGTAERNATILQGKGFIDSARIKKDSLLSRKDLFRQFSLRQYRFYQQVTGFFAVMDPVVEGCCRYLQSVEKLNLEETPGPDIHWHTKELIRMVNQPYHRPSSKERLFAPRLYINQLLGANCLFHSALLRILMKAR